MKTKLFNYVYYGILHAITILTATVLVGGLAGISVPAILFGTGIGTIIFTLITKGATPIALGSSGAWLGTCIAMSAYGLDHVLGVTILGGIWYVLFALLIKWKPQILKVFTPYILHLAVMMIALNLVGTAVGLVMAAPVTAITTVIAILVFNHSKAKRFAFPLGIVAGTIIHAILYGLTPSLGGIYEFGFTAPAFNVTTLMASLAFIGIACEALGDSKLVSEIAGTKYEPDKVILGNGVASIVAGLFGMMPVTTYSESCGLCRATKHTSKQSIIICGLIYLAMAFIPAVNYVIGLIPGAALAGMLLYLFSMVGVQKMSDVTLDNEHKVSVATIGLAAFFLAPQLLPSVSQICVGMVAMIVTHLILLGLEKFTKNE